MRWFLSKDKEPTKVEPKISLRKKYANSLPTKEDLPAYQEEMYQYFKKEVDSILGETITNHIVPKDTLTLFVRYSWLESFPKEVLSYVIPRLLKEKGYSVIQYRPVSTNRGDGYEYNISLTETGAQE